MAALSDVTTAGTERAFMLEMRSPDGPIWSGQVLAARVPAVEGAMGILPRHAPFLSALDVGQTSIREAGGAQHAYVTGPGFVEVTPQGVLLLVDFGDRTDGIDRARAEAARDRAQARLRTRGEELDRARARAALERALARLRHGQR